MIEAFLVSTGIVAVAEIGDKTQLLALALAARHRAPVPILLGILVATLANHALAALLGGALAGWMQGPWFQLAVGVAFLAMAGWALIPDKEDEAAAASGSGSVFVTTTIAFFLVEIGDKTQIATSLLAARFGDIVSVTAGTTLGMMLANAPVVLLGGLAVSRLPMTWIRRAAALALAVVGVGALAAGLSALRG